MLTVGRLTAEHPPDPLGLDVEAPRLSWVVFDAERQDSYRIRVTGDRAWDGGEVSSDQNVDVPYGGR